MFPPFRSLCWITCWATLCGCRPNPSPHLEASSLTIYVAASLTDAIQEVAEAFTETRPSTFVFNFASSGALAQQLIAAPRADLFLSASERWMQAVEATGKLAPGSATAFLSNSLCVVAHPASNYVLETPKHLPALTFRHLAIGDPESVPAGRYARAWLETLIGGNGLSIWETLAGRLSPAPDVRAALAQVENTRDVVGIVYGSDYVAHASRVRQLYALPASKGPSIRYFAGRLAEAPEPELAQAFLDFLDTEEARAIFERYGFTPIHPTVTADDRAT